MRTRSARGVVATSLLARLAIGWRAVPVVFALVRHEVIAAEEEKRRRGS